jgi:hypothetical protein
VAPSSGNSWRQVKEAGGVQEETGGMESGSMILSKHSISGNMPAGPSSGI